MLGRSVRTGSTKSALVLVTLFAASPMAVVLSMTYSEATFCAFAVWALVDWDISFGPYLLAGGAIYLLGTIGLTIAYHVPRNNALAAVAPDIPEGAARRAAALTGGGAVVSD